MTPPGVRANAIVDEFLLARLNGDATLRSILSVPAGESRVANMLSPKQWGDGPMVVYQQQTPMRTVKAVNRDQPRVQSEGVYIVKAIGHLRRSSDPPYVQADAAMLGALTAAANRLDVLLQGASGSTSNGYVTVFDHLEAYHLPEPDRPEGDEPDAIWLHVGAMWTVQAG